MRQMIQTSERQGNLFGVYLVDFLPKGHKVFLLEELLKGLDLSNSPNQIGLVTLKSGALFHSLTPSYLPDIVKAQKKDDIAGGFLKAVTIHGS